MENPSKSDTKLRYTQGKFDRFHPIKMKTFFMTKLSSDKQQIGIFIFNIQWSNVNIFIIGKEPYKSVRKTQTSPNRKMGKRYTVTIQKNIDTHGQ